MTGILKEHPFSCQKLRVGHIVTYLTHWHTQPAVRRAEPSMPLLLILALGQ
jgi:hypothetical protein